MKRILIQQLIDDKPLYDQPPYSLEEAKTMDNGNFEVIVIHKIAPNIFTIIGIEKEFVTEVIILWQTEVI